MRATVSNSSARILAVAAAMFVTSVQGGGPTGVGTLGLDPAFLAGADAADRLKINAPNPVQLGSSIHHWSQLARPNLLMEQLAASTFGDDVDLTDEALSDLGWPLGSGATITVTPDDGVGEGFNDPSPPILPAPGNSGATLGAQRLEVVEQAAAIWGAILQSAVPIEIIATFDSLPPCSPAGGTFFAFGGPQTFHANFANAPIIDTWYTQAQANALAGIDQDAAGDISNVYNSDIDAECLGPGTGFYYGLDHVVPAGKIDLLQLAMHEIGHGLGFLSLVDLTTGSFPGPPFFPDAYSSRLLDTSVGLRWSEMATDAERQASAVNTANVVFDGAQVAAEAPSILTSRSALIVGAPTSIAGSYEGNFANFGAPLSSPGVTAPLACGVDSGGVSPADACEPLTNLAEAAGSIVFVDRGTCSFAQKAGNVQAAGGVGLIAVNNVGGDPVQMAGPGPGITIPLLMLSQADGNMIRSQVCGGAPVVEVPTLRSAGIFVLVGLLTAAGAWLMRGHRGRPSRASR